MSWFIFASVLQEEEKRGQPNFEHLDEDLHVLIMVEDTDDRARLRLSKAVEEIKILMTPPVSEITHSSFSPLFFLGCSRNCVQTINNSFDSPRNYWIASAKKFVFPLLCLGDIYATIWRYSLVRSEYQTLTHTFWLRVALGSLKAFNFFFRNRRTVRMK